MGCGLRSTRERVIQTLWLKFIGLLLIAPLYASLTGASMKDSFAMGPRCRCW
jgi:uncharacterized membrane protein